MSKNTIETVSKIVGDRSKILRVNARQPYPRTFTVIKTANHCHSQVAREAFIKKILDDIKRGSRVVVVSSSRTFAEALLQIIKADPAAWERIKDAYRFYSANSDDAQMQEDLKHVNEAWCHLAFLMYTPVLTVGNNFSEKGIFDKMYVFASPASVSGNDLLQSAFRVRNLNDADLTVFIAPYHCEDLPVTLDAIQQATNKQAEKYRAMIMEYGDFVASMKDRQLIKLHNEICDRYDDPEERLRAYQNIFERLERRHQRLYSVADDTPEALVINYRNFVRHVNMWRKHYATMFKELVTRMGHEYAEVIVDVPESSNNSNSKMDTTTLEQDLVLAYFAFQPLTQDELARLQSLQTNKKASAEDKIKLQMHFFEFHMTLLKDIVGVLPNTQRARIFAKVYSDKRYSRIFAQLVAESKSCEEVLRQDIACKDGLLELCSKLPQQRKVIERVCIKLGIKHTLDTNTRVSRSVVDDDIAGWNALMAEARNAFGIRASRAKASTSGKLTPFRKTLTDINMILRTWSDVELKDVNGRSKREWDGVKLVRASELSIARRDFSALFDAA